MVLLHWCTLVPGGESSLAAVRFTAPIRVSFIRVFPTGTRPFEHSPELVACTEPDAFFLDVFFNALPTSTEPKEKQRATNALVPTSIAYAGGQVDFAVDMGTEFTTRLMIVKGEFQSLSMAIYGETVSEPAVEILEYKPKPLPRVEPLPLSKTVDPSNMLDPTHVANQLLLRIPDSPPLALVIRLMFCLKPSDEDWDLPEFPYLHADLDIENDVFDLEAALLCTVKPVRDDISYEALSTFATKVAESIGPKSSNQAYLVAQLLSIAAPQHLDMARTLLQQVPLDAVFDARTMDDESTLLRLLYAVANADIARHLSSDWFLAELSKLEASPTTEKHALAVARRLGQRIRHWAAFEDALSNAAGDMHQAARMLKDVGLEEQSIGIWLETMLNHPNLVAKLAESPVSDGRAAPPTQLLRDVLPAEIKHAELIAFTRAYIGVASVLAVWAWTDSLGNDDCRAQTLAIVRLWQNVDGYREIVNHLLLLRQLTRRLEWITTDITTDNIPPRKSGILAEQILADLTQEPHAVLRDDVVRTIFSLNPPLSFIAENERLLMRKVAYVADDGLGSAINELTFSSSHPLSLRRLRIIRVSLAIVKRELEDADAGEWRVLEALWGENSHGLVEHLADIFLGVAADLNAHFTLAPTPPMNQALIGQLFRASDDLLRLIAQLTPALPMTSRALRGLTAGIADVFACTNAAFALHSQSTVAGDVRQTCLELVSKLSLPQVYAEPRKLGAEVVLRALLEHGTVPSGRDPAGHFLQVFELIDHILPETAEDDDPWVTYVLPSVLSELGAFFCLLDPGNKVRLIKRVVKLDDGVIGLGEWLLLEELKQLKQTLESLGQAVAPRELELVRHHQVFLALQFLSDLVHASSSISDWCMSTLTSVPEAAQVLATCLTMLLDAHLVSPVLNDLTRILATRADGFDPELKFALVLSSLRAFQHEPLVLLNVLKELPADSDDDHREMLRLEIGQTLSALAHSELTAKTAQSVLSILVWLVNQDNSKMSTLCGISEPSLSQIYTKLEEALSPTSVPILDSTKATIRVDDDDAMIPASVELPSRLELSLQDLERLLHPLPSPPSTPKGISNTPDILGIVTSPAGLLRSPAATGLTKTYANNDFRVLRQAARLNTSRLPSMHVDDFELASGSPVLDTGSFQSQMLQLQFNTQ
ncbi:hypothetical protein B0H11DRAFT_2108517 [Mycena galericulata]|nr:hypothetical protein B0H11DRAFT_2108517 [Mycena galericulata]